jgi:hypothetical protein
MATLANGIEFTGSLGGVSGYKVKGSDKTYIRTKGGGNRKKIKKSVSCIPIMENATDFGKSSTAGSNIRWMLTWVKHLADYNFSSILTSLGTIFQKFDKENSKGERAVRFSEHRNLLPGFNLNLKYPFDSVVRHPFLCTINRETISAFIQIPEMIPGVNLILPWKSAPMYRFIISLGVLTDEAQKVNTAKTDKYVQHIKTDWQMAQVPYASQVFELQLDSLKKLGDDQTLIVAVGIEMGVPITTELISTMKKTGSAKLLAAG